MVLQTIDVNIPIVAPTGLEPVTPGLKDRCARYRSPIAPRGRSIFLTPTPLKLCQIYINFISFQNSWCGAELNCRHLDFQSNALPPELPHHISFLERGLLTRHIRRVIQPLRVRDIFIPLIKILVILFQYIVPKLVPKVLFQ